MTGPDTMQPSFRRYPMGAEIGARDGVSFRVWAPSRERVAVVLPDGEHALARDGEGYFSGFVPSAKAGSRYRFRLDHDETLYPDPASRFQPEGPAGPSEVVDPSAFHWSDAAWPGVVIDGQVLYEMHVGTFTPEGTWTAAADKLSFLKDVGVTVIEMMPIADFPGRFGWGYDGVDLFAPTRLYGVPDDLRRFIDTAHGIGLGVILDVVYNHFGPDGNYLACFAESYFTDRYVNDWGQALNFDGADAHGMRDFVIANAAYWIDEFHFDGLRLDATQSIPDSSPEHVIAALGKAARKAAGARIIIIVAENEPQDTRLVRPLAEGGYGLDALWNDDLHHSAMVAMTGRSEAYYEDHDGSPQEFIAAAKYGYLFQGQAYSHQNKPRGTPGLDLAPAAFVTFVQNHDQVANTGKGMRFHALTTPGRSRAMTALILLMPGTPMLFQGQEFGASQPFLYFADHKPDLAELVRNGRRQFLSQFPSLSTLAAQAGMADPAAEATFARCKLDWREPDARQEIVALHRDLLRLRRDDLAFHGRGPRPVDGAVLGPEAFLLRFFGHDGADRLLLVNLGRDLIRRSIPDPLAAPPAGRRWSVLWSSEEPVYGGDGTPPVESAKGWHVTGHSALVLGA